MFAVGSPPIDANVTLDPRLSLCFGPVHVVQGEPIQLVIKRQKLMTYQPHRSEPPLQIPGIKSAPSAPIVPNSPDPASPFSPQSPDSPEDADLVIEVSSLDDVGLAVGPSPGGTVHRVKATALSQAEEAGPAAGQAGETPRGRSAVRGGVGGGGPGGPSGPSGRQAGGGGPVGGPPFGQVAAGKPMPLTSLENAQLGGATPRELEVKARAAIPSTFSISYLDTTL